MELMLVKPQIKSIRSNDEIFEEVFEISPLEPGLAQGVFGNSFRTILLALIPGYGVTNYAIRHKSKDQDEYTEEKHAFATISGVVPSIMDISLRLKETSFRLTDGITEKDITIKKVGPAVVTYGDFICKDVKCLNPDKVLFEIVEEGKEVEFTIKIREGRGWQEETAFEEEGFIALDGLFSPVEKVSTKVEETRVEGVSGYQKLLLTIKTNGKLTPKEALSIAIRIGLDAYSIFKEEAMSVIANESIFFAVKEEEDKPAVCIPITEMGLSVRARNALSAAGINTSEDLKKWSKNDIKKVKNLGKRTLNDLLDKLAEYEIELKKDSKSSK